MTICVLTHFPSPHVVELLDEVDCFSSVPLRVYYLHRHSSIRSWSEQRISHQAVYLSDVSFENAISMVGKQKPSLFIVGFYNHPTAARIISLCHASGVPWVFWGERPNPHCFPIFGRLYRSWKLRRLHQSNAPIWGIGKLAIKEYKAEFGCNHHFENIPYFVNLDRFRHQRKLQTKRDAARVILFSGRLIRLKGIDLVARAFARLVDEGFNIRLKIMGKGKLVESLRRDMHGCRERVEFAGFRDWNELPEVYASADILCAPSRYDGWGMMVLEGLAVGLPVISTVETGSAVELISPESNGWLIPAGDFKALYLAMRDAATISDERLAMMSQCARVTVQHHSLAEGAKRFVAAAEDAIARGIT